MTKGFFLEMTKALPGKEIKEKFVYFYSNVILSRVRYMKGVA